jgi:hypothetical protein
MDIDCYTVNAYQAMDSVFNIHCIWDLDTFLKEYCNFIKGRKFCFGGGLFYPIPNHTLSPLLFVPATHDCLISISQLASKDLDILFDQDRCTYPHLPTLIAILLHQDELYDYDTNHLLVGEYLHRGKLQCLNMTHVPMATPWAVCACLKETMMADSQEMADTVLCVF